MKNIKAITSISLALLVCSPIVYADNSEIIVGETTEEQSEKRPEIIKLTLSEAIEEALENNPDIEKSKLDLKKAEVDFREGNYNIRANKKMLYNDNETSLDYLKMVTLLELPNTFSLENAKRKVDVTKSNIETEVEELYFNLVQAQNMIDVNKSNIELSKRICEISQIKLDLGLGVKQEVLNNEMNYTKAKESYDQSMKNLENAKMLFNTKLGLGTLQKIELLDKLEYKEFNIQDLIEKEEKETEDEDENKKVEETVNAVAVIEKDDIDKAIEQAFKNRNEIKIAEFSYDLEALKMDVVRKEYPSITFVYRQQEVELDKSKEALENMKNSIEMEIRSSYKEIMQKEIEISSAKGTVELAKEGLRIAKVNYEAGSGIKLDVENAQNALKQAELGLSNAIFKYNMETLKFKTTTGLGRIVGGM